MKRRCVLSLTGGAAAFSALPAIAQSQRVVRVGTLGSYPTAGDEEFRATMKHRGWEEGRNLITEPRYSKGDIRLYPSLVKELVELRVDLILALGDFAVQAAFGATRSIPIVGTMTIPMELGVAKSLSRPGGNVTGLLFQAAEYQGKQVEILRAIRPDLRRLGIVFVDNSLLFRVWFAGWQGPAEKAGISLIKIPQPFSVADVESSLAVAKRERVEAVEFSLNFALRGAGWQQISAWAIEHKVLTSGAEYARGEAAVAFGANSSSFIKQLAEQVDRVLRGANPAETPIQQPTVFDLIINRKLVRAMGLTVPQSVLVQATEVID
jgi:putative ABC transport system substrate-binding protein